LSRVTSIFLSADCALFGILIAIGKRTQFLQSPKQIASLAASGSLSRENFSNAHKLQLTFAACCALIDGATLLLQSSTYLHSINGPK